MRKHMLERTLKPKKEEEAFSFSCLRSKNFSTSGMAVLGVEDHHYSVTVTMPPPPPPTDFVTIQFSLAKETMSQDNCHHRTFTPSRLNMHRPQENIVNNLVELQSKTLSI
jgi:hypothetical protein